MQRSSVQHLSEGNFLWATVRKDLLWAAYVCDTTAKTQDIALTHTAGEEHLLLSGEPALTAISPFLSLLLYNVFQTITTHPLIKTWHLFPVRPSACWEGACQGIIPHCMRPIGLVEPHEVILFCFFLVCYVPRAALWLGEDWGPPVWDLLRRVSKRVRVPQVHWLWLWNMVLIFSYVAYVWSCICPAVACTH